MVFTTADSGGQELRSETGGKREVLPSHSCRLWGATEGQMTRLLGSYRGLDRRSSSWGQFTHDHRDTVFSGRASLALWGREREKERVRRKSKSEKKLEKKRHYS